MMALNNCMSVVCLLIVTSFLGIVNVIRAQDVCATTATACSDVLNANWYDIMEQAHKAQLSPEDGTNLLSSVCGNWRRCNDAVSNTACSLYDLYRQVSTTNYCAYNWNFCGNVDMWLNGVRALCGDTDFSYAGYYGCIHTNGNTEAAASQCDTILATMYNTPFQIWHNDSCKYVEDMGRCLLKFGNFTCNTEMTRYFYGYWFPNNVASCAFDAASEPSLPGDQCDTLKFFGCAPQLQKLTYAYDLFGFVRGTYGYSTYDLSAVCSSWNTFVACIAQSHCSTSDIADYLERGDFWRYFYDYYSNVYSNSDYIYSVINFVSTFDTFRYLCDDSGGQLQPRCSINSDCDTYVAVRTSFPYYGMGVAPCSILDDYVACTYNVAVGQCDNATAIGEVRLRTKFYQLWWTEVNRHWIWSAWGTNNIGLNVTSCAVDFGNIKRPDAIDNIPMCDKQSHARCLVSSDLHNNLYCASGNALTNFLYNNDGFQVNCGGWNSFLACWRCNDTDSFYGSIDLVTTYLDYQSYGGNVDADTQASQTIYSLNEVVTLRRMRLICEDSSQGYAAFRQCTAAQAYGQYYVAFQQCQLEANMTIDDYSSGDECSYYKLWFRCFFVNVTAECSADAGMFIADYLLAEWTPYFRKRGQCRLEKVDLVPECDKSVCVSELISSANNFTSLLKNGRLGATELSDLCRTSTQASMCILYSGTVVCNTSDTSIYNSLSDVARPYLCSDANHQAFLANQQCYATNAATTASLVTQFLDSTDCMNSRTLLMNLYIAINGSCGSTTAGTVTGLAAQFHSILDLSRQTLPCSSLLHPTEHIIPEFIGPVYNATYNSQGPCTDFHFVCRINYTRPAAEDGARFDVSLTFDGHLAPTYKTTTSLLLDVIFTSSDIRGFFGTTVSCAIRSYWSYSPTAKTEFVYSRGSFYVGINYWTDGGNQQQVTVAESAEVTPIYFQATVPIGCLPCPVNVPVLKHAGLTLSSCSVTFTSSEPPLTIHTLGIRAVPTPGSNSRVATIYFSKVNSTCGASMLDEYLVDKIPVIVYDEMASSSCSSTGDPHIRTFDGRYFNIYFPADFVLWRSATSTFVDVHVRTRHCFSDRIACNCAVAFREGNNVVGINACGDGPPVVIRSLVDPNGPPADVQTYNGGYSYIITMPSGRYLTVNAQYYGLDLAIFAISQDSGRSEGLCGNFNGDWSDDTTPKGATVPEDGSEPVNFCKSYMVNESDSLINGHIYYPPCYTQINITAPAECQCGTPDPANCAAVTAAVGDTTNAVVFNTLGTHGCTGGARKKRETNNAAELGDYVIRPNDLPPPVNITPPDAPLNPENSGGMTVAEARERCEQPLKQSAIYDRCINYTGDVVDKIVGSCADDLRLTGNAEAATAGILAKFNQACVRGIQQSDHRSVDEAVLVYNKTETETEPQGDTSVLQSPDIASVLQTLADTICPGQPVCSGNGTCQDSKCVCNEDRVGADCSIEKDVPPTITGLRYGTVCDARATNCARILLSVSGFSSSTTSACRVSSGSEVYYTTPTVGFVTEIQCSLPMSPTDAQSASPQYTWTVSVSNDNVTFSNQIELFVYDSKCLTCGNISDSCARKIETCLVDGKCYADGESPATDSCIACDPLTSGSSFTRDDRRPFCTSTTVAASASAAAAATSGPIRAEATSVTSGTGAPAVTSATTTPATTSGSTASTATSPTSATTASTTTKSPAPPPPAPAISPKKQKKLQLLNNKRMRAAAKKKTKKNKAKSG